MLTYSAIDNYISKLIEERKASATVRAARQLLEAFDANTQLASGHELIEHLTVGDVRLFLYRNPGSSPATFNRERSVLTGFLRHCGVEHLISAIPPMKNPQKPNLILSPEEMRSLLAEANPVERVALAIGMHTGLRASDISALRVGDVDLATDYITCTIQKTGVTDRKPITAPLRVELAEWLNRYAVGRENDVYLVPSYTITPQGNLQVRPEQPLGHMHRLVQRALARVGLPVAGQGFHTLRRSAARALFEQLRQETNSDHALLVVREFLNHQSVTQTERYLGISTERTLRDEALRGRDFLSAPRPQLAEVISL
jgi:integrase